MKLGIIYQALEAWQKLTALPMNPVMAYKILKYIRLITVEHEVAEKQRIALIYKLSGAKEGEDAKIEPDSPEMVTYVKEFTAVLETEATLETLDVKFEAVLEAVKDDSLTVQDLQLLEPFFKE